MNIDDSRVRAPWLGPGVARNSPSVVTLACPRSCPSPGNYTNRKGGDDKAPRHATARLAPSRRLPLMAIAWR